MESRDFQSVSLWHHAERRDLRWADWRTLIIAAWFELSSFGGIGCADVCSLWCDETKWYLHVKLKATVALKCQSQSQNENTTAKRKTQMNETTTKMLNSWPGKCTIQLSIINLKKPNYSCLWSCFLFLQLCFFSFAVVFSFMRLCFMICCCVLLFAVVFHFAIVIGTSGPPYKAPKK